MALPKLNENPKYTLTIPSTGKKVKFRPYLVKEEKVLLIASESEDPNQMMDAILDTLNACVQEKVKMDDLTTFDIEYLFLKIRSKSVGETSTLNVNCTDCKDPNEYVVNLEDIECSANKNVSNLIELDDRITVEMRYPSYKNILLQENNEEEMGFQIIANSLQAVITDEERFEIADEPPEDVRAFVESMTKEQFEKISMFLVDMPQVRHTVEFECKSCGKPNEIELKGIQSFF